MKILLRCKEDIEARGTLKIENKILNGCTPLWASTSAAHLDVVERLLEQNADTEALGTLKTKDLLIEGCTRLWIAATEGQLDVVKV